MAKNQDILQLLLSNREIVGKKNIENFLNPPPPEKIDFGINQRSLAKAGKIIKQAIWEKKPIVVYGDYDADGICATAILWETLYKMGAQVLPFIPDREQHGYGLSKKGIDQLTAKLIITVDNGIVAHKAVEYANQKNIQVIITDHHQTKGDLPCAEAIVWSDKLAGAGVAWVLANYLKPAQEMLDLVALATVADMVKLVGPNRSLVKFGLQKINQTKRLGLQELIKEAGLRKGKILSWQIGYILAPRLNAMGRIDSGMDSLRLLCTGNPERARKLAGILGNTNRQRQELTLETFQHILKKTEITHKKNKIIFVAHESYSQGIIGLVAGKLAEHYSKPAIVISQGKEFSKGSVRSVKGFDIIRYLRFFEEQGYFLELGGHPMAAGFSLQTNRLKEFEQVLYTQAQKVVQDEWLIPIIQADCEIEFEQINDKLLKILKKFEPFGMGNFQPAFVTRKVTIVDWRTIGKTGSHLKLKLAKDGYGFEAVFFGAGEIKNLEPGRQIDILYTVDENLWNGKKTIQLKIKDIKINSCLC